MATKIGTRGNWRIYALLAIVFTAAGVCLGSWVSFFAIQDDNSNQSGKSGEISVAAEPFSDESTVQVTVDGSREWTAKSPISGVLRVSSCAPGVTANSGQVVDTVSESPLLLLYLERPGYRDLNPGDRGDDVAVLQKELARLGYYQGGNTGSYDTRTAGAVKKLKQSTGLDANQTGLHLQEYIWMPAPTINIDKCDAQVGDAIEMGQTLFTVSNLSGVIRIDNAQALGSAPRAAVNGNETAEIERDGKITDATFVSNYISSPQYQTAVKNGTPTTLKTRLVEPISSYRLPVSALYSVSNDEACVLDRGQARKVQIVGSAFGSTIVVSQDKLSKITVSPKQDAPKCK